MAHLSCAYLNTNKGIGTIPNDINKDRNSRHMGRSELNPRVFQEAEWRSWGIHNPSGFSPKWQECFSRRNNNKINRKCSVASKTIRWWLCSAAVLSCCGSAQVDIPPQLWLTHCIPSYCCHGSSYGLKNIPSMLLRWIISAKSVSLVQSQRKVSENRLVSYRSKRRRWYVVNEEDWREAFVDEETGSFRDLSES